MSEIERLQSVLMSNFDSIVEILESKKELLTAIELIWMSDKCNNFMAKLMKIFKEQK